MPRTASEYHKEAAEAARRSDLQLIVFITTLVVVGLNIGRTYWYAPEPTGIAGSTESLQSQQNAGNQNSPCASSANRKPLGACLEIFFKQLSSIENNEQRLRAAQRTLAGESVAQRKLAKSLQSQGLGLKEVAKRIANHIDNEIQFKLPGEINLGIPDFLAPGIWLGLTGFSLIFIIERRRLFWRIWRKGVGIGADEVVDHDLPVWLTPVSPRVPMEDPGRLKLETGFASDGGWRFAFTVVATLVVASSIATLAWVGIRIDYFTAITAGPVKLRIAAWISLWATLILSGADAGLLLTAAGLTDTIEWPRAPAIERYRRDFIMGAIGGAFIVAVIGSVGVRARRLLLNPRYRERVRQMADLSASHLAPGVYQNRRSRSGAQHYVARDGLVRFAHPGLQSRHLIPVATSELKTPLRLSEAEAFALDLWTDQRPSEAIKVILQTVRDRYPRARTFRPYLRLLDLAAGMAIASGNRENLSSVEALLDLVATTFPVNNVRGKIRSKRRRRARRGTAAPPPPPPAAVADKYRRLAAERSAKWTSSEGAKWREKRWGTSRRLRWDGRRHTMRT